jgi:hypothetical protein
MFCRLPCSSVFVSILAGIFAWRQPLGLQTQEIHFMPSIGSSVSSHLETTGGVHTELDHGTPLSEHDSTAPSGTKSPVSIVPGGEGAFEMPPALLPLRNQPRSSQFSDIRIQGEPGAKYQVTDVGRKLPQLVYPTDAETGARLSPNRFVKQSAEGQWVPVEATSIKVAGRPGHYVIADDSNTSTPQRVFEQKPNGDLVPTPGEMTYDGKHGVKLGLKGGALHPWEKPDTRSANHPSTSSGARGEDAQAQFERLRNQEKDKVGTQLKDLRTDIRSKLDAKIKLDAEVKSQQQKAATSKQNLDAELKDVTGKMTAKYNAEIALKLAERQGDKVAIKNASDAFDKASEDSSQADGGIRVLKHQYDRDVLDLEALTRKRDAAERTYMDACSKASALEQQLKSLQRP